MILSLIETDFKGNYLSMTDCAIARCLKRNFPNADIAVGGDFVAIDDDYYDIQDSGNFARNYQTIKLHGPFPYAVRLIKS